MISVVIPCFNEKENIERFPQTLFPALRELKEDLEIIAVDDGSSDGSGDVLKKFEDLKELKLLSHHQNRGMGAALKSGFSEAAGDWILVLDADLTFSPKDVRLLIENQRQNSSDLVSGAPRLILDGLSQVPFLRRFLSRSANFLYQLALGIPFSSFTSIFRLYRSSLLKRLEIQSDGFEINAEILAFFWAQGFKVSEAPVSLSGRESGRSKLNLWREAVAHLRLIFRLMKLVRMNQ